MAGDSRDGGHSGPRTWLGRGAEAVLLNLIASALWLFLIQTFSAQHLRWTYPGESAGAALGKLTGYHAFEAVPAHLLIPVLAGVEAAFYLAARACGMKQAQAGLRGWLEDGAPAIVMGLLTALLISLTLLNALRGAPLLAPAA